MRVVSEESTPRPSERHRDGWPAPEGGRPSPDNAPTTAWSATPGGQPQWNQTVSGPPASAQHWDTPPAQAYYEQPQSPGAWTPAPTSPTSVPPQSGPAWSTEPRSGAGWGAPQPSPFPELGPHYQPRIEPTPPKQRGRVLPLIVGIVAGALVAGVGGFFLGSATAGDHASPAPSPSSAPALGLFDAAQTAANKAKLDGELAGLAQPWLNSTLGSCVANTDKDAPPLAKDESRHVTCRYGSAWVHFVVYKGEEQKNAARTYRQQLNLNSDDIAPGVHDPSRTTGGVTGAPGKVIEYAFRRPDGRSLCGISWERDADALAAMMIEANCEEDLGGKWEPLRDLLQRHS